MKSIYFGASRFPLSRPSHSFFFVFSNSNAFLVSPTFHVRPVTGIYIYICSLHTTGVFDFAYFANVCQVIRKTECKPNVYIESVHVVYAYIHIFERVFYPQPLAHSCTLLLACKQFDGEKIEVYFIVIFFFFPPPTSHIYRNVSRYRK